MIRGFRRLHWGFKALGLLAICFLGLVWYLAQTSMVAPAPVSEWLKQRLEKQLGAEVRFSGLEVRLRQNALEARKLSLRTPSQPPYLEIESLKCTIGSGTTIGQLIRGDIAVERADIDGMRIDLQALSTRMKQPTSTASATTLATAPHAFAPSNPAEIPLKVLMCRQLHLETPLGGVDIPQFRFDIRRVSGDVLASCEIASHPFGGTASFTLQAGLDRSWARCDLSIRQFSFERALSTYFTFVPVPLTWRLAAPLIGLEGLLDLDLHWEGNPIALAASPSEGLKRMVTKELTGTIRLSGGELRLGSDRLGANLSFERTADSPWSGVVDVRQPTGSLRFEGRWLPEDEAFGRIGTRFKIDHFTISPAWLLLSGNFEPRLAPGCFSAEGNLIFDGKHIETEGVASFSGWGWDGSSVPPGKGAWKQSGNRIEASGTLEMEGGHVSGSGAFTALGPERGQFTVSGSLDCIRLNLLEKLFRVTVEGAGNGDFRVDGHIDHLASVAYDLHLFVEEPRLFGVSGRRLQGVISGRGEDWRLQDLSAIFPDGSFLTFLGTVASSGFDCQVQAERLDPRRFGVGAEWSEGRVFLNGHLEGALKSPRLEAEVWTTPLTVAGVRAEGLKGHLLVADDRLELHPVFISLAAGGMFDGSVSIDLRTGRLLGLRLLVDRLPAETLPLERIPWLKALHPHGFLAGTFEQHPLEKGETWTFALGGSRLTLASESISRLDLEGTLSNDSFDLQKLAIEAWDGALTAHGKGNLATPTWAGELALRDLTVAKIKWLQKVLPESSGVISAQGDLTWNPSKHQGRFTLFGKELVLRRQELGNLGAELSINNRGMTITQGAIDKLGVELSGSMTWDPGLPYQARLSMTGTDLSFLPVAYGLNGFRKGDLLVDGIAELQGRLVASVPDALTARLNTVEIRRNNDVVVANKPVDLHFQHGRLEVRSLELKYRQGIFGVEGMYDPFGTVSMTLSGKDFSLLALGSLLEIPNWSADGSLSLNGTISGPASGPRLAGDLILRKLTVAGRTIPEISARVRADPTEIALSPLVMKLTANQVTFEGKLPFREGWKVGDLDLTMKIPAGPIDDLPLLLPEFFRLAKGEMRADLRFSGDPRRPSVTGELRLGASELAFPGMGKPLKNVVLGMQTEDKIVRIQPLEAQLGHGKIAGGGEIDFRDGIGSMSLHLDGEKLDLNWGRIDLQRNSAHFTATGNLYNPVVRGTIVLPKGRIQLADNLLSGLKFGGKTPFETLDFVIQVEIPRNLWVRNSMLNAEMRGKFKLFGDLKTFHLQGNVQTVQGALYFQRRKFLIENGEIRFGESDGKFDPHVYFKSSTNIQNTQIYMTLEGLLSQIKPRLYSSPPLAEGDILALITLGRNIDQMEVGGARGQLEKDILENLKNTYLTGLLSSTLTSALNLDEMYFGSLFDRATGVSRSFLRIGKYLGHNVFLAYEGTLSNEDKKTYIIEYRLPRGFLLNLEVEKPTNATRVGVKYDWKF